MRARTWRRFFSILSPFPEDKFLKRALIIGGGAAGCSAAHQLTLMGGWDVLLVEAAPVLGAGVRTSWYGGHPYTFGPRHSRPRTAPSTTTWTRSARCAPA